MTTKRLFNGGMDDPDAIESTFEDISGIQEDLDQELDAIFSEFGGDDMIDEYQIRVYRPQKGKGNVGYLFACLPSELPILDKLRDEYGGGDFEVRIIKNNKIFRRRRTLIEPPIQKKSETHQNNSTSELMLLVQTMNNGFNQLGELIAANHNNGSMNPVEMQGQMLTNMLSMKELLGSNQTPQESPIKMMAQLVEIQKALVPMDGGGGGAGTGDLLLSMANQILPKLAEMGEQEQKMKTMVLKRQLMTPQNGRKMLPRNALPGKMQQKQKGDNPMRLHLIFLCSQAKADRDPFTYAQMVVENTAPEKIKELKEFIAGPNSLKEMTAIHKAVGNYPVWFKELGECILQILGTDPNLTKPPLSSINLVSSIIPGTTGSQTIASIPNDTNADDDAIISDP